MRSGPAPTLRDMAFDYIYGKLGGTPDQRSTANALTNLADFATLGVPTGVDQGMRDVASGAGPFALGMALVPGARGVGAAERAAVKGIRAYHGSPHNISSFDRPAYFSTNRDYASKFGNVYEVDLSPKNPYYTNDHGFVERLRSFPEYADELRSKGHDAVILSSRSDGIEPIMGLGGIIDPQIYTLDSSIVQKAQQGTRGFYGSMGQPDPAMASP